jgi:predicted phage terminase large subunit-like protein
MRQAIGKKTEQATSSSNLSLLQTEPWTPPADAAPSVSLHDFIRGAWRILEPSEPFVDDWHIELFCQHAEAVSRGELEQPNLLINTPPGSSKSLIWAVFWPAWEWTWAPWTRWLTTSYDDGLAMRDAVKTRRLMKSPWYQQHKTQAWSFVGDQNVKSNYLNDKTGWRIAASMTGEITGNHAHRVLVDDPHHVKRAESDMIRENTVTTWREVFPSRVLPSGVRVMIGQRTHEEDCSAEWLTREGERIHHIELREEYEAPAVPATEQTADASARVVAAHPVAADTCSLTGAPHDRRVTEGELLTPDRFDREVIEQRKIELGPYAYAGQYQQTPTPRAGALLNPAWILQTPTLEASTVDLVCAFDLNYSEAETSDWTVGLLAAVDRTPLLPRIHLIDAFREHLSEDQHVEHIGDWLVMWRPIMVGIERRAYEKQGAAADLCRQLMGYCEERGFSPWIEPIDVDTDKVTRAMIIPGRAKAGLITADKRTSWWTVLSRQMSQFPRSSHDDDVDALAHLVRMIVEKLDRLRGMQGLLGHSSQLVVAEPNGKNGDLHKLQLLGLR